MNVVIASCFRNAAGDQVARYFRQVEALRHALHVAWGASLRVLSIEGDSTDATRSELQQEADKLLLNGNFQLVERSHGGPVFASTEDLERMKALSWVGNGAFENMRPSDDVVFYVESDLLWDPLVPIRLMHWLQPGHDIVSPLVFAGEHFYDVFAYRDIAGERFSPFHPYSSRLRLDQPTEVSSVGSCLVMRGEVARSCRIPDGEVLIGFCRVARERGYKVWVDARERIQHP